MFEYVQNFVHEEKMLISHLNWVVVLVNLNAKSANCHDEGGNDNHDHDYQDPYDDAEVSE